MPFRRDFPATARILSFQAKNGTIMPTILILSVDPGFVNQLAPYTLYGPKKGELTRPSVHTQVSMDLCEEGSKGLKQVGAIMPCDPPQRPVSDAS